MLKKISRNKTQFITSMVLLFIFLCATIYFSYNIYLLKGIENFIRFAIVLGNFILFVFLLLTTLIRLHEKNKVRYIIFTFLKSIYIAILVFISFNISVIYDKISNVGASTVTYSTSLVTLNTNSNDKLDKNIKGEIGLLSTEDSYEGNIIPKEIISDFKLNNEIKYYDSYLELIEALEDSVVDYIFLPPNYVTMFSEIEEIKEFLDETKIIHNASKEFKLKKIARDLTEPFSILLMGVDSEEEDIKNSSFNGDALMVVTFNPKTLNATLLSIPRDTYLPITCFKGDRRNKITHAAWYGEACMIDTIENAFDIPIDYHVKINFKGLVNLVDTIGGITVDVPYSFCEQNSDREWEENIVYVKEGVQQLDGEQALALSRNRKNNSHICGEGWGNNETNDFVRGNNQQLVISAILNKMKSIRSIDKLYETLDSISKSMETNMGTEEILSFYNIGKDILKQSKNAEISDVFNISKLGIKGYDQYIADYSQIINHGSGSNLYNFVPYQGSIRDISLAMKRNLGSEDIEVFKTISFDINEPYKEEIIGKGYYNESAIKLLPNFSSMSLEQVRNYTAANNLELQIENIEGNSNNSIGQIIGQFPMSGVEVAYTSIVTVKVVNEIVELDSTDQLPSFVGISFEEFNTEKEKYDIEFIVEEITELGDYEIEQNGEIVSQNISNIAIEDIEQEIIIKYLNIEE